MRPVDAKHRMPWATAGVAIVLALALSGCSRGAGDDDFANSPRKPVEITLSAAITQRSVTVSPSRFGAGTVELIASNLTARSQRVTLRSQVLAGGAQRLEQRTGPINPGDTASLKADLTQGTYRVTALPGSISPATITVGPPQAGAEDGLLQP